MPPPPSELLPPPPNEQQPRKIGRSSSIEPLLVIQLPEPDMANSLNIPNATNAAVATEIHNNINPKELNVHVPPPRSTDGVFANLAAKPEIMQLPKSPYPLDAAAISDAPPVRRKYFDVIHFHISHMDQSHIEPAALMPLRLIPLAL